MKNAVSCKKPLTIFTPDYCRSVHTSALTVQELEAKAEGVWAADAPAILDPGVLAEDQDAPDWELDAADRDRRESATWAPIFSLCLFLQPRIKQTNQINMVLKMAIPGGRSGSGKVMHYFMLIYGRLCSLKEVPSFAAHAVSLPS